MVLNTANLYVYTVTHVTHVNLKIQHYKNKNKKTKYYII